MCQWPCCGTVAVASWPFTSHDGTAATAMYAASKRSGKWVSDYGTRLIDGSLQRAGAGSVVAFGDGSALAWTGLRGTQPKWKTAQRCWSTTFGKDGTETFVGQTSVNTVSSQTLTHAYPWGDGALAGTEQLDPRALYVYRIAADGTLDTTSGTSLDYRGRLFDTFGASRFLAAEFPLAGGDITIRSHAASNAVEWEYPIASGITLSTLMCCFAPNGDTWIVYTDAIGSTTPLTVVRLDAAGAVVFSRVLDGSDSSGATCRDSTTGSSYRHWRQMRCDKDGNLYLPCVSEQGTSPNLLYRYIQRLDATTGIPQWDGEVAETGNAVLQYGRPEAIDVSGRYVWATSFDQTYTYSGSTYSAGSLHVYDRETGERVSRIVTDVSNENQLTAEEAAKASRYWTSICASR